MSQPARPARSVVATVAARRHRRARARRQRRHLVLWLVVALVAGTVSFGAGLLAAPMDYSFQPIPPRAVLLLDSHGRVFATIRAPQDEEPVTSDQIPRVMKNAIVAAEDERFFEHRGVDPLAAVRAAWRDLTGGSLQGGSTITQQYVKNVYTGDQRTALRKLREASLAIRLEQHLTKDEILTRYLNTLYLGNGTAGVQAASRFYFGVPIDSLDLDRRTGQHDPTLALARAATLAGMAPAPSLWNPVHDPAAARKRELYVLNQMVKNRMVTPREASAALGAGLPRIVAQAQPDAPTIAPEFRDLVARRLESTFNDDKEIFNTGGVRVTTTLDLNLQKAIVQAIHETLPKASDPEAAVVAMDPRNGDIRAIAEKKEGGYKKNGFDLATQASRSSGSTIKPFTLAVALQQGHSLDEGGYAPECLHYPGTPSYDPCNAEGSGGYYTLRTALADSINTVFIPLAKKVGLRNVFRFAQRAGMQIGFLDRRCGGLCLSQAIGVPVSALGEANGFATLVNHGVHHTPRTVLDVRSALDGDLFAAPAQPDGNRVIAPKYADAVTGAMQDVVDYGTGTAAHQPFPVYGKTGTTDNFLNAWFTGCTRKLCISVWMGYNHEYLDHGKVPHEMRDIEGHPGGVYGGSLPAEIFAKAWDNYRVLNAPHHGMVTPSPLPAFTPRPTHSTVTPTPKPRRTKPTPVHTLPPSRSPSPSPSPSPSQTLTLIPGPGSSGSPSPSPSRRPRGTVRR